MHCAQYLEDQWIEDNLPLPSDGFYVDLGCAHPIRYSNTAFLRERGWRGLAIDGNADYRSDWIQAGYEDHFVQAIISENEFEPFLIHENSAASRIHRDGWLFKACTLNDVLKSRGVGKIDFLSVDLEGAEFDALRRLDFETHNPTIIISEYVTPEIERPRVLTYDLRLLDWLTQEMGYKLVYNNSSNHVFFKQ